jgi:hypothetical protein
MQTKQTESHGFRSRDRTILTVTAGGLRHRSRRRRRRHHHHHHHIGVDFSEFIFIKVYEACRKLVSGRSLA